MAAKSNAKDAKDAKADKKREPQRGTQDELEIMRLVILSIPGLRQQVLERIRQVKERVDAAKARETKAANE